MKKILLAVTLLLTMSLAAGCGSTAPTTPATPTTPNNNATTPTDTSLADVKKAGKLQIGMSGEYPPFAYRQSDGTLTGFDVEYTTEIAKRLGVQPEYVTMPFKGLMAALDSKRFDLIANQMAITPQRQEKYDFSTPYVQSGAQLLVKKGNTTVKSLADVKGKRFAANAGSNYEKMLIDAGAEIVHYDSGNANIYSDIAAGRIEGTMNDPVQLAYLVKTSNLPLATAGQPGEKIPNALLFRKGNTALVNAVNKAYADMQADGTFLKLSEKWFGQDVSK